MDTRLSGANNANNILFLGMGHNDQAPVCGPTDREEVGFPFTVVRIGNGSGECVTENRRCLFERDPVIEKVFLRLTRILVKFHSDWRGEISRGLT